ncbi:hypothetical protein CHLNCDRAFT_140385 [Chlorella variabilis]|uniref:Uncharacterized protein n=1 Tax=Chlorella variabilis TaxID=554065 RepID=E1Z6X3_CHLVA|nr:hypothetical protein CHLNCDRAFT_140385 [Chlorella variabilis]EFN58427.1 hypothetical protein CHLNCDRAFT_140385 [Chlorella variabilis]|eukprot:XP_005850529.1 hypothetical protein CHLNCDRAFT_140385 [Chlorella variabilis]
MERGNILDFWKHGQKGALVEANGVRESNAWAHLNAFLDITRTVAVALEQLQAGEFDTVTHSLHRLAKDFKHKFSLFNGPMQTQRAGVLRGRK